jgi:hypothetical protein
MGLIDFGKGTRSASRCRQPSGIASTGDDQIYLPATESGTDKPLPPIENRTYPRRIEQAAISAGSGSTWWRHILHHTINRTFAIAALPSVMGGPGCDFMRRAPLYPRSTARSELIGSTALPLARVLRFLEQPGPRAD